MKVLEAHLGKLSDDHVDDLVTTAEVVMERDGHTASISSKSNLEKFRDTGKTGFPASIAARKSLQTLVKIDLSSLRIKRYSSRTGINS